MQAVAENQSPLIDGRLTSNNESKIHCLLIDLVGARYERLRSGLLVDSTAQFIREVRGACKLQLTASGEVHSGLKKELPAHFAPKGVFAGEILTLPTLVVTLDIEHDA